MTTLAQGASVSLTVTDGGIISVATNGGMGSIIVTPTVGSAESVNFGPLPARQKFGPYSEGATAVLSNQTAVMDYDSTPPQSSVSGAGLPAVTGAIYTKSRLLVFGNSIAAQSGVAFDGVNNAGGSDQRASTATFVAGSVQTIAAAAKIAIRTYTGEVETDVVASTVTASTSIPLVTPTRKMVRASSNGTFTVYTTDQPSNIRQNLGIVSCAMAMLGYQVEIINPSYGYGGATIQQMVADLPNFLRRSRPQYVALHLLENNMTTGESFETVLKPLLHKAVEECLRAGAVPIVYSAVPSTTVNDAPKSAVWDAQSTYINGGGLVARYPLCKTVDVSTPWLDATAPTSRPPVSGVATDGTHPDGNRRFYCAAFTLPTLTAFLPTYIGDRVGAAINANPTLSGSGGGGSGAGFSGSVATSYSVAAAAGVTAVASKNADGSQKIVFSVAGASNISSTDCLLTNANLSMPTNFGPATAIRGWVKLRINSQAAMALIYPQITFSGGEVHSSGQNETNMAADSELIGRIITVDLAAVPVPGGATTASMSLRIRPQTVGSPSGTAMDVDVLEMGIEPASIA